MLFKLFIYREAGGYTEEMMEIYNPKAQASI